MLLKICTVIENVRLTIRPEYGFRMLQIGHKFEKKTMTSEFADMTSLSIFFDVVLFFLPSLVTGSSFVAI